MQDRTHCPSGHPYTAANTTRRIVKKRLATGEHVTYVGRTCRICGCIKDAVRHMAKRKGADMRSEDVAQIVQNREAKYLRV